MARVIMYMGTIVSGYNHAWAQTCVGTNVSGRKHMLALTCVGTNVSGLKRLRAQSCWTQTCAGTPWRLGTIVLSPITVIAV